jgi:hypothetical protein
VKKTPGLQKLVLNRLVGDVFGGSAPYIAIAEMDYPDQETWHIPVRGGRAHFGGPVSETYTRLFSNRSLTPRGSRPLG